MKPSKFLLAFLCNLIIGLALFITFKGNPIVWIAVVNAAGVVMHLVKVKSGIVFFDGLATEIWLPDVKDNFYPDWSFMKEPQDLSSLVDHDAINLAEAGADPDVLVDNTVYPVGATDASDTPGKLILKTYDTTSTVVRNAVALELAYDQRILYTGKHKNALLNKFALDGAYAYSPTQNAALNPVLDATGDAAGEILDRIIDLQVAYNNINAPTEGRILVLDSIHAGIIAKEDKKLYKSFEAEPGKKLFGFNLYVFSANPFYIKATGVKAAQGVAFNGAIHARSSFSFLKTETMKGQGTFKMFSTLNDPGQKGDVFNFQMRGLASKMRNKYAGAIIK